MCFQGNFRNVNTVLPCLVENTFKKLKIQFFDRQQLVEIVAGNAVMGKQHFDLDFV